MQFKDLLYLIPVVHYSNSKEMEYILETAEMWTFGLLLMNLPQELIQ